MPSANRPPSNPRNAARSRGGRSYRLFKGKRSPFQFFLILSFLITLCVFAVCYWKMAWPAIVSYLIAINVVTLLLYVYDKPAAKLSYRRVPEKMLHLQAALGGSPVALLAQLVLRHKTIKRSFRIRFWAIFIAQVVIAGVWIYLSRR